MQQHEHNFLLSYHRMYNKKCILIQKCLKLMKYNFTIPLHDILNSMTLIMQGKIYIKIKDIKITEQKRNTLLNLTREKDLQYLQAEN